MGKRPLATVDSLLDDCRRRRLKRERRVGLLVSMFCQRVLKTWSGTVDIRIDPNPLKWIENVEVTMVTDDGSHFYVKLGRERVLVAVHPDPDEIQWSPPGLWRFLLYN